MRIIAGELGGRTFNSPNGHRTHPMGDRVRTALFNTLGDISGLTVLDAFGGTGALSFEAVSRGASEALVLEIDKDAYRVIRENIDLLDVSDKVDVIQINARAWMNRNPNREFDLVFCDPPYNQLQEKIIEKLAERAKLQGVIVYSLPPHGDIRLEKSRFELLTRKTYGDATLAFYRKVS